MFSPSQAYYIINVEWEKFVDTHGKEVWLWIGQDKDVETAIAENRTPAAGNIRWRFLDCPHQPDTFYIVNDRHEAFLDTHGTDLSVWNNGGRGVPQTVAGNTSKHAGNIRWWVLDCPHQPGTFYIVNARHRTFLDADCGKLSLWSTGRDVADVIAENTSRYAANIRWHIRPVLHAAGGSAQPVAAPLPQREVRIVHLSDTHSMHRDIEARFPLPDGDILVHTGDFSNNGTEAEIADFDAWLGEVGPRYKHVIVIPGNHDWWDTLGRIQAGKLDPKTATAPRYMQRKFGNCRVLDQEEAVLEGLRFFGSAWCPWQKDGRPDSIGKSGAHQDTLDAWQASGGCRGVFGQIPPGVDVLLTHGPAADILDSVGSTCRGSGWGSSLQLFKAIMLAKPRAHLFGHLHEQRGEWRRSPGGFEGGVEYIADGRPFPTIGPPPPDYPCELVSCNAMSNHPGIDGTGVQCIAGPARLIIMALRC